jgi:hypothetical protein
MTAASGCASNAEQIPRETRCRWNGIVVEIADVAAARESQACVAGGRQSRNGAGNHLQAGPPAREFTDRVFIAASVVDHDSLRRSVGKLLSGDRLQRRHQLGQVSRLVQTTTGSRKWRAGVRSSQLADALTCAVLATMSMPQRAYRMSAATSHPA